MKSFIFLFSFIFAINLNAQVIDILPIQKNYNNSIDTLHLIVKKSNLKNIEISTIDCMPDIFRQDSAAINIDIFTVNTNEFLFTYTWSIQEDKLIIVNNNILFPDNNALNNLLQIGKKYYIKFFVQDKFYRDYGKRLVILTVTE